MTKQKYHYTKIVTTEYVTSSVLFFIFGALLAIGLYYSWTALFNCDATCADSKCNVATYTGMAVWALVNMVLSIVSIIMIFWFLIDISDLPKIKVKGEGWSTND